MDTSRWTVPWVIFSATTFQLTSSWCGFHKKFLCFRLSRRCAKSLFWVAHETSSALLRSSMRATCTVSFCTLSTMTNRIISIFHIVLLDGFRKILDTLHKNAQQNKKIIIYVRSYACFHGQKAQIPHCPVRNKMPGNPLYLIIHCVYILLMSVWRIEKHGLLFSQVNVLDLFKQEWITERWDTVYGTIISVTNVEEAVQCV